MNYLSVADTAKSWNVSERTVRNYCATGKIPGGQSLSARHGTFRRMQSVQNVSTKSNKHLVLCLLFYRMK